MTDDDDDLLAAAFRRGAEILTSLLEASGGGWSAAEAAAALQITRHTVRRWHAQGRLLAISMPGGVVVYPRVQCRAAADGSGPPRPYPQLLQITQRLRSRMKGGELFALLATPQPMLPAPDGRPQTAFEALASDDVASVLALVEWIGTPADAEAPRASRPSRADSL
ncbi:MAG: helix-turn-helix domain-containing protein [Gemmatimonadota bacterium]